MCIFLRVKCHLQVFLPNPPSHPNLGQLTGPNPTGPASQTSLNSSISYSVNYLLNSPVDSPVHHAAGSPVDSSVDYIFNNSVNSIAASPISYPVDSPASSSVIPPANPLSSFFYPWSDTWTDPRLTYSAINSLSPQGDIYYPPPLPFPQLLPTTATPNNTPTSPINYSFIEPSNWDPSEELARKMEFRFFSGT